MTEEQPKSLDTWAADINKSRSNWPAFYNEMLGVRVSSIPRLFRAVNLYGFYPVFEAIVETSARSIQGDPINYVLKVASNKWREENESKSEEASYADSVKQSQASSIKANTQLEKRIERARKKK